MFSQLRKACSGAATCVTRQLLHQQPRKSLSQVDSRSLSTIALSQSSVEPSIPKPLTAASQTATNTLLRPVPFGTHQCVRTKVRVYYKGSAWKRYNKHNIEKRLTTPGGLEMLWRKTLKGRLNLAAYERILPNTVDSKILPQHHFKYKAHPLTKKKLPKPGLF